MPVQTMEFSENQQEKMYITGILSYSVIADRRRVTQHLVTTTTLCTNIFHGGKQSTRDPP